MTTRNLPKISRVEFCYPTTATVQFEISYEHIFTTHNLATISSECARLAHYAGVGINHVTVEAGYNMGYYESVDVFLEFKASRPMTEAEIVEYKSRQSAEILKRKRASVAQLETQAKALGLKVVKDAQ